MYRSVLKMSVLFFVLLNNNVSFGMIMKYKNEEMLKSAISYGKRIAAKFAQEERERWKALSKEEQDFCKLEKLYKNQNNPKFVANFLRKNFVPVLLVNLGDSTQQIYMSISPYEKSFYREPNKQIFDKDDDIFLQGQCTKIDALVNVSGKYHGDMSNHFISTIICGKKDEVIKELDNKQPRDIKHSLIYRAINTALSYPRKNNALELLLSHEHIHTKKWTSKDPRFTFARFTSAMFLLTKTASNKELFELISNKDPYDVNRELYCKSIFHQPQTLLEWMKECGEVFDKEHIDIFMREGGGMTTQEVIQMNYVDRILQKTMTFQELEERRNAERIINDINILGMQLYKEEVRNRNIRERINRITNLVLRNLIQDFR